MIKINLKIEPRGEYREMEVAPGTTIETLYKQVQDEMPYTALMARLDNQYASLLHVLEEDNDGSYVDLLDMRTHVADHAYQSTLVMITLVALKNVLPEAKVVVDNSLNRGLYLSINKDGQPTEEEAAQVQAEMRRLVDADMPILRHMVDTDVYIRSAEKLGRTGKARLLRQFPEQKSHMVYELDGYIDYVFGPMAPSTGYIQYFEFIPYKYGALVRFPLPKEPDRLPERVDQQKLYNAFGKRKIWDRILGIEYAAGLNERIADGSYRELILLSEALHEKEIVEIASAIKQQKKRIVLIAGPSSSGKTTFAKRLCIQLKVLGLDPLYMGTDDYFVERKDTPLDEHGEPDYENLEAIDLELFNRNMNDLLAGKEVDLPTFDFMEGKKVFGKRLTKLNSNQMLVIEGIHALNEAMTSQIPRAHKYKVYISPLTQLNIDENTRVPTTDERMLRRMVRDYQFRGHSAADTIRDWPKVRAGEDRNIFPFSEEADVLFNSYYDYEIAVLKKYAEPLLQEIRPDQPEYAEAMRILKFFEPIKIIEDDSQIANNSILREFIGGSVFVE